jgi:translocation and assembly module TamB
VKDPHVEANLHLAHLNLANKAAGSMEATAHIQNRELLVDLNAQMTNASFQVHGKTELSDDFQTQARFVLTNLDIDPILQTFEVRGISAHSSIVGTIDVTGPLKQPRELRGEAKIDQLSVSLVGVPLKTEGPLHATLAAGRLHLDPFHVVGEDTNLHAQGSVGLFGGSRDLDLHANGSINMKLAQTLDADLTSSGHVEFNVDALGTFQQPNLTGQITVTNVEMSLQYFPNGLSQVNGTLVFDQNRLQVKKLSAISGGGQLDVGGFITFQQGVYADLTATAKDVRVRYPQGISSMADARMRLLGTPSALLLSGNVTITRFVIRSDLDLAAFTTTGAALPPDPNAPANRVRLDIHLVSAPQLDFQNSFARLAGDVDLRIRGTLAQPSVLGHISITQGNATFAGTEYELQHGDIYFTNPVRIDPLIDLSATAHVQDYDITIGLNGTPSKLTPTFRSTPPLSEQDIFSLLAVGRTQEEQQIFAMQQQQLGVNSTADTLLGGALNATVSTRIQKLFGVGSVRIDPNYISGVGNSTARITVAQQIGRNAVLTYATNINTTAQQLIQAQVNITQTVSVLAVRDESGVFSLLFRIRRRYR